MNILDLSAEEFELTLKELGLEPEREQFLRDEYAKKNTVSGQMLGAFQEATDVPEGRERATIAPMTKPEGMSGLEAIRSGEAELAVPGFLTGAVEDLGQALTTGEKIREGIAVTEEELQQAAEVGASLGMSGAATRLGQPLDRSVISSGGAAGSGKPFKPSMFSAGDVPLKPSGYSVAEFYSPVVETIRNTEFPSKGYKGSELLKLLQDKTPGVRKAELDAMNLGIDPQKRYTQEELLDLAQRRSYRVSAEVVDNDIFQSQQRQDIRDPEVEYATLKVNATPNSEEVPAFLPKMGYTHYDPETIAHTRVSVREGKDGSYLLIEELQSDLLQHGSVKPRGAISRDAAYDEVLDNLSEALAKGDNKELSDVYFGNKEFFDTYFKLSAESSRQTNLKQRGIEIPEAETQELESLLERTQDLYTQAQERGEVTDLFQRMYNTMDTAGFEEGPRIDRRTAPTGKSPLTEDSDAVRLSLQAAMAKAADSDVKSLVIPNVERIVAADRARPGSKDYLSYVDPKSGFTRTYVKGVEKFIKQLQDQYGDAVKVEVVELPYTKQTYYYEGQELNLPTTAIKIDFSGIKDVDFRVSRFAEGGIVEDNQMRKLFQEGGMTDDGMDVEPVTGNEVPPGSLAKEVRDDVPAQLSEGEYIVPADVVRFFGVKFFEDLRMQAKQGLMEMDKDGRIGGTPVNEDGIPVEGMDDEEELTPEEEQMLREALGSTGMAYGGMVEAAQNPYQNQATLYQTPAGMAEGGYAGRNPAFGPSFFDRTKFVVEPPSAGFSAGFMPPAAPVAPAPAVPVEQPVKTLTPKIGGGSGGGSDRDSGGDTPTRTGGSGSSGTLGSYDNWANKNRDAILGNPYEFGVNALQDTTGKWGSKGLAAAGMATGIPVLGLAGAAIGAGNKIQNIAEANAALRVMEAQGLAGSSQYKDLQGRVNSAIGDLPMAQQLLVESEMAATGMGYYTALEKTAPTKLATTTRSSSSNTPAPVGVKKGSTLFISKSRDGGGSDPINTVGKDTGTGTLKISKSGDGKTSSTKASDYGTGKSSPSSSGGSTSTKTSTGSSSKSSGGSTSTKTGGTSVAKTGGSAGGSSKSKSSSGSGGFSRGGSGRATGGLVSRPK